MTEFSAAGMLTTIAARILAPHVSEYLKRKFTRLSRHIQLTEFDLLGIAWQEAVEAATDNELEQLSCKASPTRLRKNLGHQWFTSTLLGWEAASSVGVATLVFSLHKWPPPELSEPLVRHLAQEVHNTLLMDEDQDLTLAANFVRARFDGLGDRVRNLLDEVPNYTTKRIEHLLEQTHASVSGVRDEAAVDRALTQIAQRQIALASQDVFGRVEFDSHSAQDLPLLPLSATYVEPSVSIRGSDKSTTLPVPALAAIRSLWNLPRKPFVILTAPFGFGKSLTCKMLSVALSQEWASSERHRMLPILISAPRLFRASSGTVRTAIITYLENETLLSSHQIETLLRTHDLALILDAFDEVELQSTVAKERMGELLSLHDRNNIRVLLASRDYALDISWFGPNAVQLEIEPFNQTQIESWLATTGRMIAPVDLDYAKLKSRLDAEVIGTPIILLMASWGWSASSESDVTRLSVYARFLDKISKGKWDRVQAPHPVIVDGRHRLESLAGADAFRQALALMAWEHLATEQLRGNRGLTLKVVETLLRRHFGSLSEADVNSVTKALCLSLFFRKSDETDVIEFTHRSFREYLCATLLVQVATDTSQPYEFWARLADVTLGESEISFFTECFNQDLSLEERQRILATLDDISLSPERIVVTARAEPFEISVRLGGKLLRLDWVTFGDTRIRRNAVQLLAAARGYPPQTIHFLKQPWRLNQLCLGSSMAVTDIEPWTNNRFRSFEQDFMLQSSFCYERETGKVGLLLTNLQDQLDAYRRFRERFPEQALPTLALEDDYAVVDLTLLLEGIERISRPQLEPELVTLTGIHHMLSTIETFDKVGYQLDHRDDCILVHDRFIPIAMREAASDLYKRQWHTTVVEQLVSIKPTVPSSLENAYGEAVLAALRHESAHTLRCLVEDLLRQILDDNHRPESPRP